MPKKEWEVERVLDRKKENDGSFLYLTKWCGYKNARTKERWADTWEPISSFGPHAIGQVETLEKILDHSLPKPVWRKDYELKLKEEKKAASATPKATPRATHATRKDAGASSSKATPPQRAASATAPDLKDRGTSSRGRQHRAAAQPTGPTRRGRRHSESTAIPSDDDDDDKTFVPAGGRMTINHRGTGGSTPCRHPKRRGGSTGAPDAQSRSPNRRGRRNSASHHREEDEEDGASDAEMATPPPRGPPKRRGGSTGAPDAQSMSPNRRPHQWVEDQDDGASDAEMATPPPRGQPKRRRGGSTGAPDVQRQSLTRRTRGSSASYQRAQDDDGERDTAAAPTSTPRRRRASAGDDLTFDDEPASSSAKKASTTMDAAGSRSLLATPAQIAQPDGDGATSDPDSDFEILAPTPAKRRFGEGPRGMAGKGMGHGKGAAMRKLTEEEQRELDVFMGLPEAERTYPRWLDIPDKQRTPALWRKLGKLGETERLKEEEKKWKSEVRTAQSEEAKQKKELNKRMAENQWRIKEEPPDEESMGVPEDVLSTSRSIPLSSMIRTPVYAKKMSVTAGNPLPASMASSSGTPHEDGPSTSATPATVGKTSLATSDITSQTTSMTEGQNEAGSSASTMAMFNVPKDDRSPDISQTEASPSTYRVGESTEEEREVATALLSLSTQSNGSQLDGPSTSSLTFPSNPVLRGVKVSHESRMVGRPPLSSSPSIHPPFVPAKKRRVDPAAGSSSLDQRPVQTTPPTAIQAPSKQHPRVDPTVGSSSATAQNGRPVHAAVADEEKPYILPPIESLQEAPFNWLQYLEMKGGRAAPAECFWERPVGDYTNPFVGQEGRLLVAPHAHDDLAGEYTSAAACSIVSVDGPWIQVRALNDRKGTVTRWLWNDAGLRDLLWPFYKNVPPLVYPLEAKDKSQSLELYLRSRIMTREAHPKDRRVPKDRFLNRLDFSARPTTNKFRVGDKIETYEADQDEGCFSPATIGDVIGESVLLVFDDDPSEECNKRVPFNDPRLFPCGFASAIGEKCRLWAVEEVEKTPAIRDRHLRRTGDDARAGPSTSQDQSIDQRPATSGDSDEEMMVRPSNGVLGKRQSSTSQSSSNGDAHDEPEIWRPRDQLSTPRVEQSSISGNGQEETVTQRRHMAQGTSGDGFGKDNGNVETIDYLTTPNSNRVSQPDFLFTTDPGNHVVRFSQGCRYSATISDISRNPMRTTGTLSTLWQTILQQLVWNSNDQQRTAQIIRVERQDTTKLIYKSVDFVSSSPVASGEVFIAVPTDVPMIRAWLRNILVKLDVCPNAVSINETLTCPHCRPTNGESSGKPNGRPPGGDEDDHDDDESPLKKKHRPSSSSTLGLNGGTHPHPHQASNGQSSNGQHHHRRHHDYLSFSISSILPQDDTTKLLQQFHALNKQPSNGLQQPQSSTSSSSAPNGHQNQRQGPGEESRREFQRRIERANGAGDHALGKLIAPMIEVVAPFLRHNERSSTRPAYLAHFEKEDVRKRRGDSPGMEEEEHREKRSSSSFFVDTAAAAAAASSTSDAASVANPTAQPPLARILPFEQ